jgi:DNA invertase Pin-like site-specific DNA recombinase
MYEYPHEQYRGMRTLLLTRVSTPKQEEGYGHPAQEQEARKKLIDPLNLDVVDIIRIAHSGLDFLEDEEAEEILRRAKRGEFDLLTMDVLDRLGRKGLERELWRMRLRATGARILTTDPNDHADDDSFTGELVRLINGHGSEQELNNTRRRTMNGRRAKAEGRQKDGTIGPRKVIGQGHGLYGYNFVFDEHGKKMNFSLNHKVVHKDQYGVEWTEVKVIIVIFEMAADGVTLTNIALYLNERGIPSPEVTRPRKRKKERTKQPVWQRSELSRMLHQSDYWGERHELKTRPLPKVPGQKRRLIQQTPEAEQVIVPVPAIVTKGLAEKAHQKLAQNQAKASRNNPNPEDSLLRAGYAKCAHCGSTMTASRSYRNATSSKLGYYVFYQCSGVKRRGKCKGCTIPAHTIDDAAWEKVVEIVNDPSGLAKKILARKTEDPTEENRKNINKKLTEIRQKKTSFQKELAELMMEGKLKRDTKEFLMNQLSQLEDDEQQWKVQLAKVGETHDKWKKVHDKLNELLEECEKMRENLSDSSYTPSYKTKRDFIEYLGITVTVWRPGYINPETEKPQRYVVECDPPDIKTLIASITS